MAIYLAIVDKTCLVAASIKQALFRNRKYKVLGTFNTAYFLAEQLVTDPDIVIFCVDHDDSIFDLKEFHLLKDRFPKSYIAINVDFVDFLTFDQFINQGAKGYLSMINMNSGEFIHAIDQLRNGRIYICRYIFALLGVHIER